ncbi:MAG: hypothetical protein ACI868_001493, partial [Granulosicoccus sp.]
KDWGRLRYSVKRNVRARKPVPNKRHIITG